VATAGNGVAVPTSADGAAGAVQPTSTASVRAMQAAEANRTTGPPESDDAATRCPHCSSPRAPRNPARGPFPAGAIAGAFALHSRRRERSIAPETSTTAILAAIEPLKARACFQKLIGLSTV